MMSFSYKSFKTKFTLTAPANYFKFAYIWLKDFLPFVNVTFFSKLISTQETLALFIFNFIATHIREMPCLVYLTHFTKMAQKGSFRIFWSSVTCIIIKPFHVKNKLLKKMMLFLFVLKWDKFCCVKGRIELWSILVAQCWRILWIFSTKEFTYSKNKLFIFTSSLNKTKLTVKR